MGLYIARTILEEAGGISVSEKCSGGRWTGADGSAGGSGMTALNVCHRYTSLFALLWFGAKRVPLAHSARGTAGGDMAEQYFAEKST